MATRLSVGVVGCGSFGKNAYVRNILSDAADVVALCDVRSASIESVFAEHYEGVSEGDRPAVYNDYRKMLDAEVLDIVMVGTMADIRPDVTVAALERGSHVLAAKPMAFSLDGAERMIEAARLAGRHFMVGYNFRFRQDATAMRAFIAEGGIGQPMFARAWSHEMSVPTWGPHYIKAQSGGGSLASTAVHVIDLAVWFLGGPEVASVVGSVGSRFHDLPSYPDKLEEVRDTYDTEDVVSGHVMFTSGQSMTVEGMWLAPDLMNKKGVDVWGSAGYASLEPFRLMSWEDGDYVDRTEGAVPKGFQDDSRLRTTKEVHHFIDCCLGKCEPLITLDEMLTDQAIVDGIYGQKG